MKKIVEVSEQPHFPAENLTGDNADTILRILSGVAGVNVYASDYKLLSATSQSNVHRTAYYQTIEQLRDNSITLVLALNRTLPIKYRKSPIERTTI